MRFLLENLENPEHPRQFHQLIHPAKPRYPGHIVVAVCNIGQPFKWNYSKEVNQKPGFKVILCYRLSVLN